MALSLFLKIFLLDPDPDQQIYSLIKKQFLLIQLKASPIILVRSKIHLQPFNQPGPGVDSAGNSDIAALKLGDDAPGVGRGDGDGDGAGSSNSSGSGVGVSMNEQVTQFLEGEGDGDGDIDEQRGQGAEGQGDGQGGDAALGKIKLLLRNVNAV